ncbi:MAG: TonB-dependent receptor [Flavobacteriaceae bacterium]|nr:TonB-dependent receptor [Flavobacteriaceae bacterium]
MSKYFFNNHIPMMHTLIKCFFILTTTLVFAQEASILGSVSDEQGNPISFATVIVTELPSEDNSEPEAIKGAATDESGIFKIEGLEVKQYQLIISYIGFDATTIVVAAALTPTNRAISLQKSMESLEETVVAVRRPVIKKEAGKLILEVENSTYSVGNTFELLRKTPGVLILNDQIQVKNATPVIFLNGKRVYLSSSEIASLLKNMEASVVKSIEVITNPSAKYDAEASTVLNIVTSRAVSIGYKGSVRTNYEQAIFPKYSFGTSQFYKNQWLDLYGSYSFSPRKEFKKDDNFIRFFEPDQSTQSIWESEFQRTTRSNAHQANLVIDMKVAPSHTISVASNLFFSPDQTYDNTVDAQIYDPQRQLDSTFMTNSDVIIDRHNATFNLEHKWVLSEAGAQVVMNANYIDYRKKQEQSVNTDYFSAAGDFLRNNNFNTTADQQSTIYTGQLDFESPLLEGTLEAGAKFSNIETESGIDFFDVMNGQAQFNETLSDNFLYDESIWAAYLNFSRSLDKWKFNAGLRGEYTDVLGDSRSLGIVNEQEYFQLFPSASVSYQLHPSHTVGIAYARRIERPRYESLNPFIYFLNENNFNQGNPNLTPAIETKVGLDYNFKNKLFIEAYYQKFDNALGLLTFQDNETFTLQSIDANLISDLQYSLDIVIAQSLRSWWYVSLVTSTFYMENEFFTVKSEPETYSNNVIGFYANLYQGFTLSKEQSLNASVNANYISKIIYGNYTYKNRFNLSVSLRKQFWDDRANLTIGVDDIFNTNNIPLRSRFYNQDNWYFAQNESRLFKLGFQYNFGNARLRDNSRRLRSEEGQRLD